MTDSSTALQAPSLTRKPEPETFRKVFAPVASIISMISALITQSGLFVDDVSTRLTFAIVAAAGVAGAVIGFVRLINRRKSVRLWVILAVAATLAVYSAGIVTEFGINYAHDNVGPPVTVEKVNPDRIDHDSSTTTLLTVAIRINRTNEGLCLGHLWLIDSQASGKDLSEPGGTKHKEVVHTVVDQEIDCRKGRLVLQFDIDSTVLSHRFAVHSFNADTNAGWAQRQWQLHHDHDYVHDGEFTIFPDGQKLVSNIVPVT